VMSNDDKRSPSSSIPYTRVVYVYNNTACMIITSTLDSTAYIRRHSCNKTPLDMLYYIIYVKGLLNSYNTHIDI
jgi:hypothetical protein